ncbi:MAG TPA: glycosyltransferase family 2 protein [Candidatus Sulfotelmatobacter sp.]|jgi:dolichol-phosphate mannosyltransferase|nr:glycosyltransferase family 2 protein [Candidatus Sulfotelmatobacter sp.]
MDRARLSTDYTALTEQRILADTYVVRPALELAIVIPTYNEVENIPLVVAAVEQALCGIEWEIVFVDDNSPDKTAEFIRTLALTNRRIRVLERIGRKGLSSACIEGILATPAPYIAVMDADMQHDESILPEMLGRIKSEGLDVVVGSRKIAGGSMGEFAPERVWLSDFGTRISKLVCRCDVSDAMSGFFLVDRAYFQRVVPRLTGTGFKILVDLLSSSPSQPRIGEVPYHFRNRQLGESKLDLNVELEYLYLLVDKVIGKWVPTRFVIYVLVGTLGLLVHLGVLALLYYRGRVDFTVSQAAATFVAMTFNFLLNNVVTFRDRRLRGWRVVTGLLTFYLACSLGALMNVSLAKFLLDSHVAWYLAGILGMATSSVWNYGVNTIFTWRRSRNS